MESTRFLLLLLFFLHSPSTSVSGDVFGESQWATGRTLLQQKSDCPINFETLNYTEVTSNCKGPNYKAEPCCKGFKLLACPYSAEITDMKSNCAKTMFSYINLYGKYPPGLFSSMCVEQKEGLDCDQTYKELDARKSTNSGALPKHHHSSFLLTTLLLLFSLFNLLSV
ncbi:hypothetical protein LguiA_035172 [Lonicera macranthoides]